MRGHLFAHGMVAGLLSISACLLTGAEVHAQSTTTLQGRVTDPNGAVLPAATIRVSSPDIGIERIAQTDSQGGKTSLRIAYAIMTEQPLVNAAVNTAGNPPNATPLTFSGTIRLNNAIDLARASGISLVTVDHNYQNSYVQSWNLNIQREIVPNLGVMLGYFGSKGTHLRISRNINQPVSGVRPFPRLSNSIPVLPGASIGNITQVEGTGNSSYNALWATVSRRLSRRLQLNAA